MKAFEEWNKIHEEYKKRVGVKDNSCDKEDTWRAALKLVLSQPGWGQCEEDVHNAIIEELNDEI